MRLVTYEFQGETRVGVLLPAGETICPAAELGFRARTMAETARLILESYDRPRRP